MESAKAKQALPGDRLANSQEKQNGNKVIKALMTEKDHLEKTTDEIMNIYKKIKTELFKVNKHVQFNSQRYYISLRKDKNMAFFHFSRKKISVVVMNSKFNTKKQIKHHEIKTLTEKVQKFWNGPSCTVVIENEKYLNEVIALLKKLISV